MSEQQWIDEWMRDCLVTRDAGSNDLPLGWVELQIMPSEKYYPVDGLAEIERNRGSEWWRKPLVTKGNKRRKHRLEIQSDAMGWVIVSLFAALAAYVKWGIP